MSVHSDAVAHYADAVERRALLVAAWEELGRPVLGEGGATGRALVPHPLIAMMREQDILCERLGRAVKQAVRGRPKGVGSAADRVDAAPPVRLKAAS